MPQSQLVDICQRDKLVLPRELEVEAWEVIASDIASYKGWSDDSYEVKLSGDVAVKFHIPSIWEEDPFIAYKQEGLVREICFARHMKANGFNVPNILGLKLGVISFVVMDRFKLEGNDIVDSGDHSSLLKSIEELGYVPADAVNWHNTGYTSDGKVFLFDFNLWSHKDWEEAFMQGFPDLAKQEKSCYRN
jgi:hypothetical protein